LLEIIRGYDYGEFDGGFLMYDVIEKLNVVADDAVSRERRGKEIVMANFKILSLNLPSGVRE
jgi:hypothetical protein